MLEVAQGMCQKKKLTRPSTRFQARSKDKRREVELDLQVSPEEMSREVELGCESLTSFASSCSSTAVQWTLM